MSELSALPEPGRLGAVILTGGTAARMDGADKAAIELDGVTLLERALSATVTAVEVVVVGEQVPTSRPVTWTREDPVSGGPAAGLLAGLDRFLRPPDLLAVLAVDMPLVTPGTFARLLESVEGHDGAVLVDAGGRTQPLCAVYRRTALERVRPEDHEKEHGLAMFGLLSSLSLAEVAAARSEAADVDTWRDLLELRESRGGRTP
jgi:molybdopterin-guanine dinucleotide biosynthesis protein A